MTVRFLCMLRTLHTHLAKTSQCLFIFQLRVLCAQLVSLSPATLVSSVTFSRPLCCSCIHVNGTETTWLHAWCKLAFFSLGLHFRMNVDASSRLRCFFACLHEHCLAGENELKCNASRLSESFASFFRVRNLFWTDSNSLFTMQQWTNHAGTWLRLLHCSVALKKNKQTTNLFPNLMKAGITFCIHSSCYHLLPLDTVQNTFSFQT